MSFPCQQGGHREVCVQLINQAISFQRRLEIVIFVTQSKNLVCTTIRDEYINIFNKLPVRNVSGLFLVPWRGLTFFGLKAVSRAGVRLGLDGDGAGHAQGEGDY